MFNPCALFPNSISLRIQEMLFWSMKGGVFYKDVINTKTLKCVMQVFITLLITEMSQTKGFLNLYLIIALVY